MRYPVVNLGIPVGYQNPMHPSPPGYALPKSLPFMTSGWGPMPPPPEVVPQQPEDMPVSGFEGLAPEGPGPTGELPVSFQSTGATWFGQSAFIPVPGGFGSVPIVQGF